MSWNELHSLSVAFDHPPGSLRSHSELRWWMLDWLGRSNDQNMALMMMHLYHIWLARNDAREAIQIEDPRSVARRTVAAIEEWNNIQNPPQPKVATPVEHWQKPGEGWCKANADGAYRLPEGVGGAGVIIRDHHGSFLAGAGHFLPQVLDAEGAELLACRRAVMLAKEVQVNKVVLETDCMGAELKLLREDVDRSVHGPLVEEIRSILRSFEEFSVRTVRRTANEAAHLLAKDSCVNKYCKTWLGVPPAVVVSRLALDLSEF
jgi:ribonuclease HI